MTSTKESTSKSYLKNPLLLLFIAVSGLILAGRATAQTFKTLYTFSETVAPVGEIGTNSDGANPVGPLILSGNTLYGEVFDGGIYGFGTVFAVHDDGTGYTNLHSFTGRTTDGDNPIGGLVLSGNTLYGATQFYGISGYGTIFAVNTDGTGFTNLHSFTETSGYPYFTNSDGANPLAGLILSGETLYGTALDGGISGFGALFSINTGGKDFTNLYSFTAEISTNYTNSNGANPEAPLILSGDTLYGTAVNGGSSGRGTVFAVYTNGLGFTNLHTFADASGPLQLTNSEGISPVGGMILMSNVLYGTAYQGGSSGYGSIFALNTDGTGFTNLHNFSYSGGANPIGKLILNESFMYGTTQFGGIGGYGTVFSISADGTSFTNLYSFTSNSGPIGLLKCGYTLFGTAGDAGSSGNGTIFSLSFAPQLGIGVAGTNVILTWPTNVAGFDYSGFTLQSATNLFSTNWSTVSPSPVIVNGQNTVTNAISQAQMFYRLIQ